MLTPLSRHLWPFDMLHAPLVTMYRTIAPDARPGKCGRLIGRFIDRRIWAMTPALRHGTGRVTCRGLDGPAMSISLIGIRLDWEGRWSRVSLRLDHGCLTVRLDRFGYKYHHRCVEVVPLDPYPRQPARPARQTWPEPPLHWWGVKRTRFYVFEYLTETFHSGISSHKLYVLKPL